MVSHARRESDGVVVHLNYTMVREATMQKEPGEEPCTCPNAKEIAKQVMPTLN